jgi:large conductance mechanosensitive channel
MVRDFKEFALKGNVLELAVAFILGAAFTTVVNSFVNDVLMNLIAAIGGRPDFSGLTFAIGDGVIGYGNFLTAATTFLLIALMLFVVVKAAQRALPAKITQRDCPHCLSRIPIGAAACSFCTRDVPAG